MAVDPRLRERAQAAFRADKSRITGLTEEDRDALLEELHTHQIELEIQNEDLRAVQLELQAARDGYAELYEQAPVAYLTLDGDDTIQQVNLTAAELFGKTRSELVGSRWSWFLHRDDQDVWYLYRKQLVDSVSRHDCELRIQTATHVLIVQAATRSIQSPVGTPPKLLVSLTDVTQRRAAEQELRQRTEELDRSRLSLLSMLEDRQRTQQQLQVSEQHFHSLLASLYDVVWSAALDGRYIYLNRAVERVYGLPYEACVADKDFWWKAVLPEDLAIVERANIDLFEKGHATVEYRIRRPNGGVRWLLDRKHVVKDGGGIVTIGGIVTDITERRRAENELRLRQAAIADSATPTAFGDGGFHITYANQAFLDLFGFESEQQVIGMPMTKFDASPTLVAEIIAATLKHGRWNGETTTHKLDGTAVDIFLTATLLRDELGQPVQSVVTMLDVTARKQAEAERLTARQELADRMQNEKQIVETELSKAREALVLSTRLATIGRVAAQMAHELRNPLGAVRNAAYFIRGEVPPDQDELVSMLQLIDDELATADVIIRNLLNATRPPESNPRLVDVIGQVKKSFARLLASESISLRLDAHSTPANIQFDPLQLRQLLDNLLSNACDAVGDSGQVTVQLCTHDDAVELRVIDSGSGIPLELRDSIFEPFFTTKPQGTGLGLAICRQIIEQHGGTIRIEDGQDGGSQIVVQIPNAPHRTG